MSLKSGGDAANIAAANTESGNADVAGLGVTESLLGSQGLAGGLGLGATGDAATAQGQAAAGGDVTDNTALGGININT